jgi:hypothetical protein
VVPRRGERRGGDPKLSSFQRLPRRSEIAAIVAIVTAAVLWWTWGSLQPLPTVQDEYSYLLQAKIFAHLHWTAPPPPVPSSFQQPHVLTTPRVASKYPPGHALLLAMGAAVGAPWLVPLVLSGISAALIFLLAESLAGPWIALLCWAVWLGDPVILEFQPGYFSEVTSGLGFLASWWFLRRWRASGESRWLVFTALAVGWTAITRPLTALMFAVPVGMYVIVRVTRERQWRHLVLAGVAGAAVLAILPLWSARTTGKWNVSPVTLYTRDYLPFDKPGFGFDSTPPALALSPITQDLYDEFSRYHKWYTPARVPTAAWNRARALMAAEFGGWRIALVPFVLVGLAFGTGELWLAIACAVAVFAGYLSYAYWSGWTLYSLESVPVIAFCAANGFAVVWRWLRRRWPSRAAGYAVAWGAPSLLALLSIPTLLTWRHKHIQAAAYDSDFYKTIATAPFRSIVVFVRYSSGQHPHGNLVSNSPTLDTDRMWIVMDDPARNEAVMRAANGRVPVLFEEKGATFSVYQALVQTPERRTTR